MDKNLDPFGVIIIAFVTAIGGGTIRDVLIGDLPVSLFIFDAAGLGLFTLIGIEKGIAHDFSPAQLKSPARQ